MKKILAVIAILAGVLCQAQTAKVMPLSEADTAKIKALYAEKADVESKIEDFKEHVVEQYLTSPADSKDECPGVWAIGPTFGPVAFKDGATRCLDKGFGFDFQYSDDFKFVVPADQKPAAPASWVNGCPSFTYSGNVAQ